MSPFSALIVQHFISGDAYYTGIFCLILAVAWRRFGWIGKESLVWFWAVMGGMFVLLSGTAMFNGVLLSGLVTIGWLLLEKPPGAEPAPTIKQPASRRHFSVDGWLGLVVVVLWLFEGAIELPWRFLPVLSPDSRDRPIVVLGDSLSAESEDGNMTAWPDQIAKATDRKVTNASEPGATLRSAIPRVKEVIPKNSLVFIELGGNDLLEKLSPADFRNQLNQLLEEVTAQAGETVMFELPLPPFTLEYGQIIRELTTRHRVKLIPRRVLSNVLVSPITTTDSLHLNQAGHDKLSRLLLPTLNR